MVSQVGLRFARVFAGCRESRGGLLEFSVHSCTQGIDALGEVTVKMSGDEADRTRASDDSQRERAFHGHGADTDILLASAKAYVHAINRRLSYHLKQQEAGSRDIVASGKHAGIATSSGMRH